MVRAAARPRPQQRPHRRCLRGVAEGLGDCHRCPVHRGGDHHGGDHFGMVGGVAFAEERSTSSRANCRRDTGSGIALLPNVRPTGRARPLRGSSSKRGRSGLVGRPPHREITGRGLSVLLQGDRTPPAGPAPRRTGLTTRANPEATLGRTRTLQLCLHDFHIQDCLRWRVTAPLECSAVGDGGGDQHLLEIGQLFDRGLDGGDALGTVRQRRPLLGLGGGGRALGLSAMLRSTRTSTIPSRFLLRVKGGA